MSRPIKFLSSSARRGTVAIVAATGLAIPQAHAGFINQVPADVTNFAVLYEGNGKTLMNNGSSNITDNIGIGSINGTTGSWAASSPGTITGVVEFAAANTGGGPPNFTGSQFKTSNTTYVPPLGASNPTFSNANVNTDLTALNTLSTTLGGESGTSLTINLNNGQSQTINASNGVLDANGNRVFTLTSINFGNGATLDIQGDATGDSVVINVTANNPNFGGEIDLTGGLTADQVLFNVTGSGSKLNINTNGVTETADFLDPNGPINENHSVVNGRLFGGDTQDMSIVSGGVLNSPGPITTTGQCQQRPNRARWLCSVPVLSPLASFGAGIARLRGHNGFRAAPWRGAGSAVLK